MRQPAHLIVAFDKHRGNRQRRSFQPSKATFDVILVPIFPHGLLQRQALLWPIAGIGTPAQPRHEVADGRFIALDRGDLVAHPLAHLLWTGSPTASTPDKLDGLLALSCKGVGEQTHDPMLRQHCLGGTQQRRLGFLQAVFQVTALCFCIGMGTHHQHAFLPGASFPDTRPAHFVSLGQHLPPIPPRLPRSSLASAGPSHLPAPVALNNTAHMPADAHGSPAHSSCSLPQRASLFAPGRPALDQSSEYTRDHRPVPPTPPPAPAAAPKDRASPSWP